MNDACQDGLVLRKEVPKLGTGRKSMNIQIFGVKKCFDTKKAERYFKERGIRYQFVDLTEKGLSRGELQSVKATVGLASLINTECKEYKRLNLDRIAGVTMREEILLNNPVLYRTPIVRNGQKATVGYQPETWKTWEGTEA
jgi:arsenate reductase